MYNRNNNECSYTRYPYLTHPQLELCSSEDVILGVLRVVNTFDIGYLVLSYRYGFPCSMIALSTHETIDEARNKNEKIFLESYYSKVNAPCANNHQDPKGASQRISSYIPVYRLLKGILFFFNIVWPRALMFGL